MVGADMIDSSLGAPLITADRLALVARLREMAGEISQASPSRALVERFGTDIGRTAWAAGQVASKAVVACADRLEREIKNASCE
jgi:hypothetical protein